LCGSSRTAAKLEACKNAGLREGLLDEGGGQLSPVPPSESADVFLDLLGGPYTELGVSVLKRHGKLVVLGGLAGTAAALDERALMLKQLTIIGSVLRARPLDEKIAAFQSFRNWIKPLLERGKIQPNVDKVFRLDEIKAAHEYVEANRPCGKVVVIVAPELAVGT
jgi:NADPH:quinone reductase